MFKNKIEMITDKLIDMCPHKLYSFYCYYLRPYAWKTKFQKIKTNLKVGFNTEDCWNLDDSFYKWLQPRLTYFRQINNGYPDGSTWESWNKALDENIEKLNFILKYDYDIWECPHTYVTDEDVKELSLMYEDEEELNGYLGNRSYLNCRTSFNKWFGENINKLWW